MYLLFPSRHHLLTQSQVEWLKSQGEEVIFAITSSDHANTRRNPVRANRREAAITLAAHQEGMSARVYLVRDIAKTNRFARYVLNSIETQGSPHLTPANTRVVAVSVEVAKSFQEEGFSVELLEDLTPSWDVVQRIAQGERSLAEVHPASQKILSMYDLEDRIQALHEDPLLSQEGEITQTRDYAVYGAAFDSGAQRKWEILRPHVRNGRIVDVGCGVGSLLEEIAGDKEFHESDLFGIEAAKPLYDECLHRLSRGVFSNPNTFFYQTNLFSQEVFAKASINTTLTVSLMHEVFSYMGEDELTHALEVIRAQTGGVWLNLDVVGPDNGDDLIWLEVAGDVPAAPLQLGGLSRYEVKSALEDLSPAASLVQFAHDWHFEMPAPHFVCEGGKQFAEIQLTHAMEWLSKATYLDNWLSEMHESFCFWTFKEWCEAAAEAGFSLAPASHAFTNQWLVDNVFTPRAKLRPPGEANQILPWPVTHQLLIAH